MSGALRRIGLIRVRTVDTCQSVYVNVQTFFFIRLFVCPSGFRKCEGAQLNWSSGDLQQLIKWRLFVRLDLAPSNCFQNINLAFVTGHLTSPRLYKHQLIKSRFCTPISSAVNLLSTLHSCCPSDEVFTGSILDFIKCQSVVPAPGDQLSGSCPATDHILAQTVSSFATIVGLMWPSAKRTRH